MSSSNSAGFLGRYVLWMVWRSQGTNPEAGGWLAVAPGGNLVFAQDSQPLDDSAFFDFYAAANPSGGIFIQSPANGQYLAATGGNKALFANAATTAQAGVFQIGDGDWGVSEFSTNLKGLGPLQGYVACSNVVPNSALGLITSPSSVAAIWISMLCVKPGGTSSRTARPHDIDGGLSRPTPLRRSVSQPAMPPPPRHRTSTLGAAGGDPRFPYFAGKYALSFAEGWVVPTADDTLPLSQTLPTDGSGLFVVYMQPQTENFFGQCDCASFQTITRKFLRMPTAGLFGPIELDAKVQSAASATPFSFSGWFGNFTNLIVGPTSGLVVACFAGWQNNVLCTVNGLSSDDGVLTRVVAGLQDLLATGANLWDGADLSYVDMTTCVGSLTGAAAQWGNANFTGAVLAKMDLTAITIGNAVNFTNASLAGVTFKAGQDLSNAILKDADLSRVDLSAVKVPADFTGTNLTNAILKGVDLSRATCVGTNFSGCDLTTTKLPTAPGALGQGSTGAIFAGATVRITSADTAIHIDSLGSDWRNLNLSAAKLVPLPAIVIGLKAGYANLERTILDEMTFIKDASNNGASFQGTDLTGASLRGVSAEGASFSSAILYAANLSKADLSSTTWSNAFAGTRQQLFSLSPFNPGDVQTLNSGSVPDDLSMAFANNGHALQKPKVEVRSKFSAWLITDGSSAYSVVASSNALDVLTAGQTSAQFAHAYMENANLTGGSFTGVHFGGVQLINAADASGVDFEQADFSGANISSATPNQPNLAGAYLYGANLEGAFLFNADLSGAYLSPSSGPTGANLSGAMLASATLTGAQLDGAIMTGAFVALTPQGAPTSFCGVPLFTLDANKFTPILDDGANWGSSAPAALQSAFQTNGISLSGPAFFTAYPGQLQWGISLTDADYDPPPPPGTAAGWVWTTFTIMQGSMQYQGTDQLIVYGTMLWMFAPDVTGALQPEPYGVTPTALVQTDIAETTFCPNSNTWATNAANGIPWEAAMMPVPQSFRDRS